MARPRQWNIFNVEAETGSHDNFAVEENIPKSRSFTVDNVQYA
jgi:hypothetical protein